MSTVKEMASTRSSVLKASLSLYSFVEEARRLGHVVES